MSGADLVNDEFDVGYNQRFETGWHRTELVGRVVMVVFVVCATLGFLGRGPYSHRTKHSTDGKLSVDFEPIARHSTSTTVTVHIPNSDGTSEPVQLSIDQHLIEPMGFQHAIPRPISTEFGDFGARLNFLEQPDQRNGLIRLTLTPVVVGPIAMALRVGKETVAWRMLVVP